MQFRLWHVLTLMVLILTAGVVSVQQLEAHVGKSTVPGVIVVDTTSMDIGVAETLAQRWPGAVLQWVPSDGQPVAPFSGRPLQSLRDSGWASVLLAPRRPVPPVSAAGTADAALRRTWGVLVTDLPASEAPSSLAAFVGEQGGGRPFLAGLSLPDAPPSQVVASLAPLVAAADRLPSFRRTSIVILGAHEEDGRRRLALRIDRGSWGGHVQPALADLLPATGAAGP